MEMGGNDGKKKKRREMNRISSKEVDFLKRLHLD